jgi:hypothetical protein
MAFLHIAGRGNEEARAGERDRQKDAAQQD